MVGRNQYGYVTAAFSGSPWWGEINPDWSGCGGNEQKLCKIGWKYVKLGENPKMPHPKTVVKNTAVQRAMLCRMVAMRKTVKIGAETNCKAQDCIRNVSKDRGASGATRCDAGLRYPPRYMLPSSREGKLARTTTLGTRKRTL